MPTAGLLFIALIALYIAASGRAKKILEAIGAKSPDAAADTGVPSTDGQGLPADAEGSTNVDLLSSNAALYNQMLTNPGSLNNNTDNPNMQTNYGVEWNDILGYFSKGGSGIAGNGYLGPPQAG